MGDYTPGPYRVAKCGDNHYRILAGGIILADCGAGSKGNADLFAAAPDLLAACYEAANFFHNSSDGDICTEQDLCVFCKAITKAQP